MMYVFHSIDRKWKFNILHFHFLSIQVSLLENLPWRSRWQCWWQMRGSRVGGCTWSGFYENESQQTTLKRPGDRRRWKLHFMHLTQHSKNSKHRYFTWSVSDPTKAHTAARQTGPSGNGSLTYVTSVVMSIIIVIIIIAIIIIVIVIVIIVIIIVIIAMTAILKPGHLITRLVCGQAQVIFNTLININYFNLSIRCFYWNEYC